MVSHDGPRDGKRGGEHVYDALVDAGIELLVGLPGTQTLPLDRVVAEREEMAYVMARHETSIPHMAWGYYEATGKPAATLTVPGPGDTNAMHGLKNAYEDCVPVIHVSADINPGDRGKGPIHEIEPDTFDNAVKANVNVESTNELTEKVARGIEIATTSPYGPVRLGVPSGFLEAAFEADPVSVEPERVRHDNERSYEDAADALARAERPVVYVGGGARRSPDGERVVQKLADAVDAPVFTSYKGKGVFREDDPRFAGVTAKHLPAGGKRVLDAADVVLALGTDFDGVTTGNWSLSMGETLIHVNLDVGEIDAAYESDVAIVADVGRAGDALLDRLEGADQRAESWDGTAVATAVREEYLDHLADEGLLDTDALTTPNALRTVRETVPRETVVTTDIGGFRLWAKQVFEAYDQRRYITAGSWAGMGVGLPSAIGAKAARPDTPVVSLHGDGGLMMCLTELHTAVEHDLDVTVVVFNNRDYGIISKSPKIEQYTKGRFEWESPDFAGIAEGFGCRGVRVDTPGELRDALKDALATDGSTLIDVNVPSDEQSVVDAGEYESTIDLS